jgi:putative endonuclease
MNRRIRAEARGRRSETLAAWALRLKGYRILARRLKTKVGEIDMVALPPFGPVCFIEVKARGDVASAALAVAQGQRTRIACAADLYLAGRPDLMARGARLDIIAVAPGRWPQHHADAWRPEDL